MSDPSLDAAFLVLIGTLGASAIAALSSVGAKWAEHNFQSSADKRKQRYLNLEQTFVALEESRRWTFEYGQHQIHPDENSAPGPNPIPRLVLLVSMYFEALDDPLDSLLTAQDVFIDWSHAYTTDTCTDDEVDTQGLEFRKAVASFTEALRKEARSEGAVKR